MRVVRTLQCLSLSLPYLVSAPSPHTHPPSQPHAPVGPHMHPLTPNLHPPKWHRIRLTASWGLPSMRAASRVR